MNSFVVLYEPFVTVPHSNRVVPPVHHPRVQHDREQTPPFKDFRQNHG
jgi:hypothetical protein